MSQMPNRIENQAKRSTPLRPASAPTAQSIAIVAASRASSTPTTDDGSRMSGKSKPPG
jgi:hypothetical protein